MHEMSVHGIACCNNYVAERLPRLLDIQGWAHSLMAF
jgi:hypothetical protein